LNIGQYGKKGIFFNRNFHETSLTGFSQSLFFSYLKNINRIISRGCELWIEFLIHVNKKIFFPRACGTIFAEKPNPPFLKNYPQFIPAFSPKFSNDCEDGVQWFQ
jgi:hypothetical protein